MKRMYILLLGCSLLFSTVATAQYDDCDCEDEAYLGVFSDRISASKSRLLGFPTKYGQYVSRIVEESAADRAGLQVLDYIYAFDGREMNWKNELADLLETYEPGDEVLLSLIRKGQNRTVRVTLDSRADRSLGAFRTNNGPKTFFGVSQRNGATQDELGVAVNVIDGTTADKIGLRDGDILMTLNGYILVDWDDISAVINATPAGSTIKVEYVREGKRYLGSGTASSRSGTASFAPELRKDAFLGIQSERISSKKATVLGFNSDYGSYVTKVYPNTAAEKAGLRPFDYIYGVDEYRTAPRQDLSDILRKYNAGDDAALLFIRQGKDREVKVTFTGREKALTSVKTNPCEDPFLGVRQTVSTAGDKGVEIELVRNGTAEAMGLENGDIITAINGFPMIDWDDIGTAVDMLEIGESIRVSFLRDGRERTASLPIKSRCETQGMGRGDFDVSPSPSIDLDINMDNRDRPIVIIRPGNNRFEASLRSLSEQDIQRANERLDLNLPTTNSLDIDRLTLRPYGREGQHLLQFELPGQGQTIIRLYNDSGRRIYEYEIGRFTGEFSDEVDIAQNGPGTYYLHIQQGSQSAVQEVRLE